MNRDQHGPSDQCPQPAAGLVFDSRGVLVRETHRPGTLRHQNHSGEWVVTSPGNPLYSTATMAATQYWDSTTEQWREILWD